MEISAVNGPPICRSPFPPGSASGSPFSRPLRRCSWRCCRGARGRVPPARGARESYSPQASGTDTRPPAGHRSDYGARSRRHRPLRSVSPPSPWQQSSARSTRAAKRFLAGSPSGGSGPSPLDRDQRHRPQQDRAALLVDLEIGFTVKAKGTSGFSRQGHSPVWAHGNYASHAPTSIRGVIRARSIRPIAKLPLDRLANPPLSCAVVMSKSVLASWYVKGTAIAAGVTCSQRAAGIEQPAHELPTAGSQATWMFALRFTP